MKGKFLNTVIEFFEQISSKPRLGGLQISDSSLQYAFLVNGDEMKTASVKLPPGIISGGKIFDRERLISYFRQLHGLINPEDPKRELRVVVSLPSPISYTQNYEIPNVGMERMEETAELNLEMISPIPAEDAYMSWQLIRETRDKFELLGAFAEKQVVDSYRNIMEETGFMPMIFEFPSLSISWTINHTIGPRKESFLILNVSGDGIDLFLLKNGSIFFDYFRSWKSIQGNRKEISRSDFNQVIVEEIRKVVNFTSSRFNENLKYVFLVAPGLEDQVKEIIEKNFPIQAAALRTGIKNLAPSWYSVAGSAIRGSWDRSKDRYVSLGTFRVEDIFYREQMVGFIRLWRSIFVGLTATFLILMIGSFILLRAQPATLEDRLGLFSVGFKESEVQELRGSANEFNSLVSAISEVRGDFRMSEVVKDIKGISDSYDAVFDSLSLTPEEDRVSVSMTGRVPSYEKVIAFKNALVGDPRFEDVNMPFSKILTSKGNFVSFDVSFGYHLVEED